MIKDIAWTLSQNEYQLVKNLSDPNLFIVETEL